RGAGLAVAAGSAVWRTRLPGAFLRRRAGVVGIWRRRPAVGANPCMAAYPSRTATTGSGCRVRAGAVPGLARRPAPAGDRQRLLPATMCWRGVSGAGAGRGTAAGERAAGGVHRAGDAAVRPDAAAAAAAL